MTGGGERGFPTHILDAAFGPDAKPVPRWLAGLITRHGRPCIVRQVQPGGSSTEYVWPDRSVRIGEEGTAGHYVVASRDRCGYVERGGLDRPPTESEISGVVALAGLDDAPKRGTS